MRVRKYPRRAPRALLLAVASILGAGTGLATDRKSIGDNGTDTWSIDSGSSGDVISGPFAETTRVRIENEGPSRVNLWLRDENGHLLRGPKLDPEESTRLDLPPGQRLVAADGSTGDGGATGTVSQA